MSSAIILFTDIISFSKEATAGQLQLIEGLTAEVRESTGDYIARDEAIALPTGDGLAIAFLNYSGNTTILSKLFELTLRLHKWARLKSTATNPVSLRIGIHLGPIEFITDINGRKNICGYTVNLAQRVMDAANPRQTLLSADAFEQLIGRATSALTSSPFTDKFIAKFEGPIDLYAKHGLQINVYKLVLDPAQKYYSNDDPVAKHLMLVGLTPLPKEIVGSFSERVSKAHDIAFIQLTGDRFIAKWEAGEIKFSPQLRRFWVFMPEPVAYGSLKLESPHASAEFVREYVQKWRDIFAKLQKELPKAELKLGLFSEPPYYGASLIDWDEPGGKIHVSPYIWGFAAPDCPGYDVEWIGRRRPEIYYRYVRGLEYLHYKTRNSLS